MSFLIMCSIITAGNYPVCIECEPDANITPTIIEVERGQTVEDIMGILWVDYTQTDVDPGEIPEGDYLGWAVFTKNGSHVLATNRITDNVTVYDWASMSVITNIEVGDYPGGIAVSDSHAVIACAFSDEVYVIDLDDFTIDTVFALPSGQQPWVVRVSEDGSRAYVGCDISNTCEVFDLETMSHVLTINDFPVFLVSYGWNSENGRNGVTFSNFELTADGSQLIAGDWADSIFFFNTVTGAIDHYISGIVDCPVVGLSGDGSTCVALSLSNPAVVHQVDIATHTVLSSVSITGHTISMAYETGVNYDGTKAYIGVSNNQSALVRFATSDFITFSSTYTAFWIGTSFDHNYAISGQYRYSIIDFSSETMIGQYQGISQYRGAASPAGYHTASFDPYRHEGVYFYDFSTPSNPQYRGTTNAGLEPEGDAPRRVAITPDGSKAVVSNVLSDNISIIDCNAFTVNTILPVGDRVQDIAITSDGQWAVVCGFNTNSIKIVDLSIDSIVVDVPCGQRAGVVSISPDDNYAYVGNISSNTVSVVALDGAASYEVTEVSCGVIGVVWAAFGVSSDVEVSPTGEYALIAASFDDQVNVLDAVTNTIVASLAVGDFPIQIAFDSSGSYATVTNAFSDNVSILYVDGASSYVVGTYPRGDYPLRLDYDEVHDEIGIGHYNAKTVVHIDPRTGGVVSTDSYASFGSLIQVEFDEAGDPVVLTSSVSSIPGHLHRGTDAVPLPAVPSCFAYCPDSHFAAVVMPGPDWVSLITWEPQGAYEHTWIPLSGKTTLFPPSPNPSAGSAVIRFYLDQPGNITLSVLDATGRCIRTICNCAYDAGAHCVVWSAALEYGQQLPTGVYFIHMKTEAGEATQRMVYVE
jgi:YVTN family beta-propeller protein